jgi:hypothetical protein
VAADDKRRTPGNAPRSGGNTPKPPGGGNRGQRAKDQRSKEQSRAESRSVSTKAPGGPRGGNRPRPAGKPGSRPQGRSAPAPGRRLSGPVLAWGSVGLVVAIVIVLVVVNSLGGSKPSSGPTPVTPAPASVVRDVTQIPPGVFDAVGVNIPSAAQPAKPIVLSGQPPLTLSGKTPAMLYYGAEYCPYCAAERWAMTAALARFGTFTGLDVTKSSGTDVDPFTPTFSYRDATYTSRYLSFFPIEQYTNVPAAGGGYTVLQNPTAAEQKVITKYSSPTYVPGAQAGSVSFPFVDVDNKVLVSGASYSPGILSGMSHAEVASSLSDPHNLVTQAIIGTANYLTAAICASTGQQPGAVCTSSGVKAADRALKLG